jgi:hypothetical protein
MKITTLFVLLFGWLLLPTIATYAQSTSLDSVKVIPTHPIRNDTVRLDLFAHANCVSQNLFLEHSIIGDTIRIEGCYTISGLTGNTYFRDTLTLGELKDKTYYIKFKAYSSLDQNNCDRIDSTQAFDTFTVHAPASIPTITMQSITLYPNPAQDILHLNLPTGTTLQKTEIHDMQGRLLLSYTGKEPINVVDLPKGLYMLLVETDKTVLKTKFVK